MKGNYTEICEENREALFIFPILLTHQPNVKKSNLHLLPAPASTRGLFSWPRASYAPV